MMYTSESGYGNTMDPRDLRSLSSELPDLNSSDVKRREQDQKRRTPVQKSAFERSADASKIDMIARSTLDESSSDWLKVEIGRTKTGLIFTIINFIKKLFGKEAVSEATEKTTIYLRKEAAAIQKIFEHVEERQVGVKRVNLDDLYFSVEKSGEFVRDELRDIEAALKGTEKKLQLFEKHVAENAQDSAEIRHLVKEQMSKLQNLQKTLENQKEKFSKFTTAAQSSSYNISSIIKTERFTPKEENFVKKVIELEKRDFAALSVHEYEELFKKLAHQAFDSTDKTEADKAKLQMATILAHMMEKAPDVLKKIKNGDSPIAKWRIEQALHEMPETWLRLVFKTSDGQNLSGLQTIQSQGLRDQIGLAIAQVGYRAIETNDAKLANTLYATSSFPMTIDKIFKQKEFVELHEKLLTVMDAGEIYDLLDHLYEQKQRGAKIDPANIQKIIDNIKLITSKTHNDKLFEILELTGEHFEIPTEEKEKQEWYDQYGSDFFRLALVHKYFPGDAKFLANFFKNFLSYRHSELADDKLFKEQLNKILELIHGTDVWKELTGLQDLQLANQAATNGDYLSAIRHKLEYLDKQEFVNALRAEIADNRELFNQFNEIPRAYNRFNQRFPILFTHVDVDESAYEDFSEILKKQSIQMNPEKQRKVASNLTLLKARILAFISEKDHLPEENQKFSNEIFNFVRRIIQMDQYLEEHSISQDPVIQKHFQRFVDTFEKSTFEFGTTTTADTEGLSLGGLASPVKPATPAEDALQQTAEIEAETKADAFEPAIPKVEEATPKRVAAEGTLDEDKKVTAEVKAKRAVAEAVPQVLITDQERKSFEEIIKQLGDIDQIPKEIAVHLKEYIKKKAILEIQGKEEGRPILNDIQSIFVRKPGLWQQIAQSDQVIYATLEKLVAKQSDPELSLSIGMRLNLEQALQEAASRGVSRRLELAAIKLARLKTILAPDLYEQEESTFSKTIHNYRLLDLNDVQRKLLRVLRTALDLNPNERRVLNAISRASPSVVASILEKYRKAWGVNKNDFALEVSKIFQILNLNSSGYIEPGLKESSLAEDLTLVQDLIQLFPEEARDQIERRAAPGPFPTPEIAEYLELFKEKSDETPMGKLLLVRVTNPQLFEVAHHRIKKEDPLHPAAILAKAKREKSSQAELLAYETLDQLNEVIRQLDGTPRVKSFLENLNQLRKLDEKELFGKPSVQHAREAIETKVNESLQNILTPLEIKQITALLKAESLPEEYTEASLSKLIDRLQLQILFKRPPPSFNDFANVMILKTKFNKMFHKDFNSRTSLEFEKLLTEYPEIKETAYDEMTRREISASLNHVLGEISRFKANHVASSELLEQPEVIDQMHDLRRARVKVTQLKSLPRNIKVQEDLLNQIDALLLELSTLSSAEKSMIDNITKISDNQALAKIMTKLQIKELLDSGNVDFVKFKLQLNMHPEFLEKVSATRFREQLRNWSNLAFTDFLFDLPLKYLNEVSIVTRSKLVTERLDNLEMHSVLRENLLYHIEKLLLQRPVPQKLLEALAKAFEGTYLEEEVRNRISPSRSDTDVERKEAADSGSVSGLGLEPSTASPSASSEAAATSPKQAPSPDRGVGSGLIDGLEPPKATATSQTERTKESSADVVEEPKPDNSELSSPSSEEVPPKTSPRTSHEASKKAAAKRPPPPPLPTRPRPQQKTQFSIDTKALLDNLKSINEEERKSAIEQLKTIQNRIQSKHLLVKDWQTIRRVFDKEVLSLIKDSYVHKVIQNNKEFNILAQFKAKLLLMEEDQAKNQST